MDPLQIFENFKLDTLDEKWSDEVWERDFLSFPEPPVEYSILLGSEDMEAFLKETCTTLKKWIVQNRNTDKSNDQERIEVSWQTLNALNINIKGLLAVLGFLMKTGQMIGADEDSRQACLASTSLYFTLLSIPGSNTYNVFHPHLYQRAIETLRLSEHLIVEKKTREPNLEELYSENRANGMLQREKSTLVKGLNSILFDLITMIKTFYMKYQVSSLEMTIICLIEVTKLESDVNIFLTNQSLPNQATNTSLSYNAYVALQDLCDPQHGATSDTVHLIMKYLMPHLCPNYLKLPSKAANVVWDTIIYFIKNLLELGGASAEPGIEILLQHLLVKCPDRSEPRQKQAGVISKLISVCQGRLYLRAIQNLIKFSFHNKISCRIFAQEVIARLLTEMAINTPNNGINDIGNIQKTLIASSLTRSVDISSMVRGKAMSIIESIVYNQKLTVTDFLDMAEENKPFPTLEELLNALEADTNPLPGPKTFNSMLLDRIKDERALVRRSAVHALQNLVTYFPPLLHEVAPIIGRHCRDPALIVRRDAIHSLASLLQKNPTDKKLLEEYTKSVLPRIFDVEVKVQEKVLESVQNLVLDQIKPFTSETNNDNNLPWEVIKQMTNERMRKNLSKISESWSKNGVITNSLISKIQVHIETQHNVEAWILLLALAENTKLTNMKKYYEDDYKEIFESETFVDTLKIEVLRYSWQSMDKKFLENIGTHIIEKLSKFCVSLESISVCIDILNGITKRLHGLKNGEEIMGSHVTNLIRLSEAQIEQLPQRSEEIDDKIIEIYLKAMSTLGHASFQCSENVSESCLNIIQSLLLDCDSVKLPLKYMEKLKATGIVVVGQQAMRDREFAEQIMPILGQLMRRSGTSESLAQAAIRINAVKALADLCIRFTALVEPYLPDLCISMKDPNSMVREAIVVIFVQLLLEDYIKVKGAFFYHILTMLSDKDETIRDLTIFLIKERLLVKNKTLISQSFIRSIFHYNNCPTKHKLGDKRLKQKEKDVLTLPGQKNQAKRRLIYDFLMEHLDPPSKLNILTKLNSEVLEGVCENFINVRQTEGAGVLKDVFYIICNDRMHASFGTKIQDEDFQDENGELNEHPLNNAIKVIVDGMKKFKFTCMLQTLIRLREYLSSKKSPLLVDISKFFIKLISDFSKDQVAELYDEHPQLKKDIECDISLYGKKPNTSDSDEREEQEPVEEDKIVTPLEKSSLEKKDANANLTTPKKSTSCSSRTPRKIQDIQLGLSVPRIVLRRISSLTYPHVKEWKSPPRETRNSLNSDPEPSTSSGISVSSQSPTEDMNTFSPDFSEPELSVTPKPKKARLSKETHVQIFDGTNID